MIPYDYKSFCTDLIALVKEGVVPQTRIDDAVRRILRVKHEAGIFETPVTWLKDYPQFGSAEFEQAAYNRAAESITLFKEQQQYTALTSQCQSTSDRPQRQQYAHPQRRMDVLMVGRKDR